MTAQLPLMERLVRHVARELDRAGCRLCPCGHIPDHHRIDRDDPTWAWCPHCGGCCTTTRQWGRPPEKAA